MKVSAGLFTQDAMLELGLLGVAFVLCALIGIERQVRQKSAGFRTHVLVGTGSAGFTLVSAFGFEGVVSPDVTLDPSRIAAQIVSGIGFLGAGVIFTRRDSVQGLTTAATIWLAAAVGMSAGAGMVSLAILLTALHLLALVVIAPLVARIPSHDHRRVLRITYRDGAGVLRALLRVAHDLGFTAAVLNTRNVERGGVDLVDMDVRFRGREPLRHLIPAVAEIGGVVQVRLRTPEDDDDDA